MTDTPQRYDLVTNYRCGQSVEELEKADDGEWVRWEDVQARIEHAEAEVAQLRQGIDDLLAVVARTGDQRAWFPAISVLHELQKGWLAPSPVPAEPRK